MSYLDGQVMVRNRWKWRKSVFEAKVPNVL